MKKKILFIILAVILIIAVAVGIIFVSLNKDKTSMTASQFKTAMEEKEYVLVDATDQLDEYDYVEKVYIAGPSDYSYQIEFYDLSDASYAIKYFNNTKLIFESSKGNASGETNLAMKNYAKYTLSSNGRYKVVSRIDNTAIYVDVDASHKDTIKGVLKEIGY